MKIKKYITIILGLITTISIYAQDAKHYFQVNAGGGFHSLQYKLQDGNAKGGPGGTFNLGYSYFFNSKWGIGTGIGIQSVMAKGTLNLTSEYSAVDEDGDDFELRINVNNWAEKQKALFLDIPIGVQYKHWFNEKTGLLAFAGAKVSIPLGPSYKVTSGSIATTGYYEQWNVELSDMPQHGFTTITDRPSDNLDFKTTCSLFADLGWLHPLSEKLDLYIGGYISYGLNNLIKTGNKDDFLRNETYNSVIASNQTEKVTVMTLGVKVGIRLHVNRGKKETDEPIGIPAAEVKEEPVQQSVVQADIAAQVEEQPEPVSVTEIKPEPVEMVSIEDTIAKAQLIADEINLKFPVDSDVPLNDEFDNKFRELAQMLKANPELKVRIQGHTCNLAGRDYNLKVSMDRAETGKAKLLKLGVDTSRIILESKAFDEPLVPNTNEENRAQNRRIKLIVECVAQQAQRP